MPAEIAEQQVSIGPFRLDLAADALLRDGEPVTLGKRAIALLRLLIARPGEIVTKDTLIERAWPGQIVEESNLTAQIAALRRVFATAPGGEGWITTLPRRGYRFTGPIDTSSRTETVKAPPVSMQSVAANEGRPSLAVLPFRVPDPDSIPRYLADGLVEDVISALAGLSDLTVISRGSSFRFRDTASDLQQIGRELGVRYIVSGSLRRSGSRLRVTGELAEAASGAVLLSRAYEGDAELMFEAQDRMVAEIVRSLVPRVRSEELRRVRIKTPENRQAYDCVLQARELIYRLDRDSFEQAYGLLDQALALDPRYAAAYALIAEWHSLRIGQNWSPDREEDAHAAERFARRAIEHDPNDARALARYAHSRAFLQHDHPGAVATFDRALEISPNNADVWMWSACTYAYLGDGLEAVRRGELGLRLSPRDWFGFQFHSTLCLAHYTEGSYADAVRCGLTSMAENARYVSNLRYTTAALAASSDGAGARDLARDLMVLEPEFRVGRYIDRHPYRDPGQRERYRRHLLMAGLPA